MGDAGGRTTGPMEKGPGRVQAFPDRDDVRRELHVPNKTDISFSIDTKDMLVNIGKALFRKKIIKELKKPGLDPRQQASGFEFANIYSLEEVQVGMVLPGLVSNLTKFGAFVNIGVKQDGLVHVSEIANRYISDPAEAIKLGQQVQVKVLEVDTVRKRIALSIKQTLPMPERKQYGGGVKKPVYSNPPKKEIKDLPMNDALAALKQKFGK